MLNRRRFSAALGAFGAIAGGVASAQQSPTIRSRGSFDQAQPSADPARAWDASKTPGAVSDEESPDYRYLNTPFSDAPFAFTAQDALQLLRAMDMQRVAEQSERVVIGLRGCELLDDAGLFTNGASRPALLLRETHIDYLQFKCVIAVWNVQTGGLWASRASTVPDARSAFWSTFQGGSGTNQISLACHDYVVGTHRRGSLHAQPNTLRQYSAAGVLRCSSQQTFRFDTKAWTFPNRIVSDNFYAQAPRAATAQPHYFSSGSQVLPGRFARSGDEGSVSSEGEFRSFQQALGISSGPFANFDRTNGASPDEGTRFRYLLTTGRQCRLAHRAQPSTILMLGSVGERVARLQTALGILSDGLFNAGTQQRLAAAQITAWGGADGVFTQPEETLLGMPGIFSEGT